eukprot:CAMPEP_0176038798 /NCGR_PEP_ID=MMETSP0120_2-20121206/19230_1 /TAXON_ID=160619 /ORGANISM="Kryptoperidinium foliaceum, Strain CCMP 1326" /LENGTH=535 /DNA_ID=CAMNT_0017372193 /DNA_START=187 /DNA_END=1794 /DNA_ORIENTATION=+
MSFIARLPIAVLMLFAIARSDAQAPLGEVISTNLDEAAAAALAAGRPEAEARLFPILAALPRGVGGRFGAPAVRYALHQDLTRSYGWHLRGLDPAGGTWNSSSLSDIAALRRLPAAVRAAISRRSADGFDAGDVAALAAALEVVVREEARRQLQQIFSKLGLSETAPVSAEQAFLAVEAYMTSLLLNEDVQGLTKASLLEKHSAMGEVYPMWPQMRSFVRSEFGRQVQGDQVSFQQAASVVNAIGSNFGGWQKEHICTDLTKSLAEIEEPGTGRVLLTDFYKAAVQDGKWQFQESEAYLRQLGALDESSPGSPRVIIPNWVQGRSNCVGSSEFHDVCCVSECGQRLAMLERRLAMPAATPEAVEAALPGVGIDAVLRNRLRAIAKAHGGRVPIYGRLFAQWLHHVYPHECSYPHRSGTTKPVNIFEVDQAGIASEEAMKTLASRTHRRSAPAHSAPWNTEEELLAEPAADASRPMAFAAVHSAVLLAAFATMALGLARRTFRGASRHLRGEAAKAKKPQAARARQDRSIATGLEV